MRFSGVNLAAEGNTLLEETSRYLPWVFSTVKVSQEKAQFCFSEVKGLTLPEKG